MGGNLYTPLGGDKWITTIERERITVIVTQNNIKKKKGKITV